MQSPPRAKPNPAEIGLVIGLLCTGASAMALLSILRSSHTGLSTLFAVDRSAFCALMAFTAALLALLTRFVGTGAAEFQPAAPEPPITSLARERAAMHGLIEEMRRLMLAEQQQWATLHESNGHATRDAMLAGARLASFVTDAEQRLTAAMDHTSTSLQTALSRTEQLATQFEGAVPHLTQLAETSAVASTQSAEAQQALTRLTQSADAAAHSLTQACAATASQNAALLEAGQHMSRDASALDQACRDIATAGATMVARASEAVLRVEACITHLPNLTTAIAAHTTQALDSLQGATAALREDRAAHETAHSAVQAAANGLQHQLAQLADLPGLIGKLGETAADLTKSCTTLAETQGQTQASATALQSSVEQASALTQSATTLVATLPSLAQSITESTHTVNAEQNRITLSAAQLSTALAGATGLFSAEATRLYEKIPALGSEVEKLAQAATQLHNNSENLRTIGRDAATLMAEAIAEKLAQSQNTLLHAAQNVTGAAQDAAANFTTHAQLAASHIAQTATALRGEAEILATNGHAATEILQHICRAAQIMQENASGFETAQTKAQAEAASALQAGLEHITQHILQLGAQTRHTLAQFDSTAQEILRQCAAAPAPSLAGLATREDLQSLAAQWAPMEDILRTATHLNSTAARLFAATEQLPAALQQAIAPPLCSLHSLQTELATNAQIITSGLAQLANATEKAEAATATVAAAIAAIPAAAERCHHLSQLSSQAQSLRQETELLAHAALSGTPTTLPPWMQGNTTTLLSALDTTIQHLKSAATAIALVNDATPTHKAA